MKQEIIAKIETLAPVPASVIARELDRQVPQISTCLRRLEEQGVVFSSMSENSVKGRGRRRVRLYCLKDQKNG